MSIAEMANILVMSMNVMKSLGAKDAINEDVKPLMKNSCLNKSLN